MRPILSLALLGPLFLAACTGSLARMNTDTPAPRYTDYAGPPVRDFRVTHLDGWNPVSRNQLVVWNGPSEAYLITVWESCSGLPFAEHVVVSSTNSHVSTLEKVRVEGQQCPIREIRPVDVRRLRAAADAGTR